MLTLPTPPTIKLTAVDKEVMQPETGFLRIIRGKVVFHYPDGTAPSEPFTLDRIARANNDAAAIVAHYYDSATHKPMVYLRSSIRPALSLRDYTDSKILEQEDAGNLWEIPAGMIETDEVGIDGAKAAAARELEEEIGFTYTAADMKLLGKRIFTNVASSAERIIFFEIEVNPHRRGRPAGDGGPMERGAEIIAFPLHDAIQAVQDGYLPDAKTEIGLIRLGRLYGEL